MEHTYYLLNTADVLHNLFEASSGKQMPRQTGIGGLSVRPSLTTWNPLAHSDQDNFKWAFLRAIEWGRWPVFLSQGFIPILLLFFPWTWVLGGVIAANIVLWVAGAVIGVSVRLAYLGSFVNQIKWVIWLPCTILLFLWSRSPESWISCFYFFLVFPMGMFPPVPVKPLHLRFMKAMGYEKSLLYDL
jgi:hypothetical protein